MVKIELELGDELNTRLEKLAQKLALSTSETAKMILSNGLSSERDIDWIAIFNKGREILHRIVK